MYLINKWFLFASFRSDPVLNSGLGKTNLVFAFLERSVSWEAPKEIIMPKHMWFQVLAVLLVAVCSIPVRNGLAWGIREWDPGTPPFVLSSEEWIRFRWTRGGGQASRCGEVYNKGHGLTVLWGMQASLSGVTESLCHRRVERKDNWEEEARDASRSISSRTWRPCRVMLTAKGSQRSLYTRSSLCLQSKQAAESLAAAFV